MSGAAGSSQWMYASGDFTIDQSLRFSGDAGGEPKLTFTPNSDPTSNKQHTVSFWVKRGELEAYSAVISAGGRFDTAVYFNGGANNKDTVTVMTNYAEVGRAIEIDAVLRDTSAWYHIVATWDTNNATSTDRHILWVNGVRQVVGTEATMPQNGSTKLMANGEEITIGMGGRYQHENRFDGCLAEFHCIDGQVLTPTSFGETGDYGEWKPIEYEGSYGNNGFYLDFSNSSALGDDKSGNGNDFTVNAAITASDQLVDSPSNNFCTVNPLDSYAANSNITLKEGNLHLDFNSDSGNSVISSTFPVTSGKWYFEFTRTGSTGSAMVGIANTSLKLADRYFGVSSNGVWAYNPNGRIYNSGSYTSHTTWGEGDVIGCAFDLDNGKVYFAKNNTWQNSANPSNGTNAPYTNVSGEIVPTFGNGGSAYDGFLNFGQDSSFAGNKTAQGNQDSGGVGDFYYTPPSGFKALCTKNLPDVAVVPSEHFNTVLYSGNGNTANNGNVITGVGFQPDFLWVKNRNGGNVHSLQDAVRGVRGVLQSQVTEGENATRGYINSFTADGFNTGNAAGASINPSNGSGLTYVAWNWKANGSGSSNSNGSITSTVSANADAGFSIVSYTGTGSAGTIGHGLSSAPEMIIVKSRSFADNWEVYHEGLNADAHDYLIRLNSTAASASVGDFWNTSSYPTNSLFGISAYDQLAKNNQTFIAYCFHSVDGYSKVGSYTGNGNADGTFVYTGFRPAFVILKKTGNDANGSSWVINDSKRLGYNNDNPRLRANTSGQEDDTGRVELLSNGFKMRVDYAESNENGVNFIFLAFAETPFKYANAR